MLCEWVLLHRSLEAIKGARHGLHYKSLLKDLSTALPQQAASPSLLQGSPMQLPSPSSGDVTSPPAEGSPFRCDQPLDGGQPEHEVQQFLLAYQIDIDEVEW